MVPATERYRPPGATDFCVAAGTCNGSSSPPSADGPSHRAPCRACPRNRGRATSDSMPHMLDRIRELESRKRQEVVGTDVFAQLAEEVLEHTRMVQRWAEAPGCASQRSAG